MSAGEIRPQAGWAVATRSPGADEDDITRLLDDGVLLRTHVLRSTWHFVLPDGIRWLVELTAPRVRKTWELHQQQLGITDSDLERGLAAVVVCYGAFLRRPAQGTCTYA